MPRLLITLSLATLLPSLAAAQSEEQVEQARGHDERARGYFDEADYAAALGEMQAAQELLPAPSRLYNMAVCEERLSRPERAIALYRRFLEVADDATAQRERAAERIEALRAALRAEVEPSPPPPPTPPPPPEEARDRRRLSPAAFWVTGGLTLASAVALVILGAATAARDDEYQSMALNDQMALEATFQQGRRLAAATNAMIGVTAAGAVATLVLGLFTRFRAEPAAPQASLRLGPGGLLLRTSF